MSRVTERPFRKPDEGVLDRLPIAAVAVTQPAEADQIVDRGR